jgi:hypothetical protein
MSTDSLTVLRAHGDRRLTKRFDISTSGQISVTGYDKAAKWFEATVEPVTGIRDIAALLKRIELDRSACVIRGLPEPDVDLARVRRIKAENGGVMSEVPRHWIMADIDGTVPLPPGCSVVADPVDAARVLVDVLAAHAPELEGVTAVVQFSSSAGLAELAEAEDASAPGSGVRWRGVAKPGINAHVWYYFDEAVGQAELERWCGALAAAGLRLDVSLTRTVQPHYTAAPIFSPGLHDPLAGRRTVIVEGSVDTATLTIPPIPSARPAGLGTAGGTHAPGRSYQEHLASIGGPNGFHAAVLATVGAYFATSRHPDPDALEADLRAAILAADPGGRTQAEIADRASARHLRSVIGWVWQREEAKRAQAVAEAEAQTVPPVEPTYPDRSVSLEEGQRLTEKGIADFTARAGRFETPEILLSGTVGVGKSAAASTGIGPLLDATQAEVRGAAVYYGVPRHELGREALDDIALKNPGRRLAVWLGMDRIDPVRNDGSKMCLEPELIELAPAAGLKPSEVCPFCPMKNDCGWKLQAKQKAEVWVITHQMQFRPLPAGLPKAAAVIIDEDFTGAGLAGIDADHPIEMPVDALKEVRTGPLNETRSDRLVELRLRAFDAAMAMREGTSHRSEIEQVGFTAQSAAEWEALEWESKPEVGLRGVKGDAAGIAWHLKEAAGSGFSRLRPLLAKFWSALLAGQDARSVNVEHFVGDDGRRWIRFAWRRDFAKWMQGVPKLMLNATTRPELIRLWAPGLEVRDIEVATPLQHIRQVIGGQFGRTFFTHPKRGPGNIETLADSVLVELAQSSGNVVVIVQAEVETRLRAEIAHRLDGRFPNRLFLAHHGNITGLNCFNNAEVVMVVGRPAQNRRDGERLAEIARGSAGVICTEEDNHWPTITAGIRMADGTGVAVTQPYHPDPLVEAIRYSISEGAVIQGKGRGRGVRRRVRVHLYGEVALPVTVNEVVTWDDARPSRLAVAAAEAALMHRALPLVPADLSAACPRLWKTPGAVESDLKRTAREAKGGQTPIIQVSREGLYRALTPLSYVLARYRKHGVSGSLGWAMVPAENGEEALREILRDSEAGELAEYVAPPAPPAPPTRPPMPPPRPPSAPTVVVAAQMLPMPTPTAHAITVPIQVVRTALREIDTKLGTHRQPRTPPEDAPPAVSIRGSPADGAPSSTDHSKHAGASHDR